MTLMFLFFMIFGVLSCMPAWFASRRRQQASGWDLFVALPGCLCWIALAGLGVGPQSLSNLVVELFDLVLGSIVLYYLKVFLLDRFTEKPGRNTAYIVAITLVAAILLRLLMPVLPE